MPIPQSIARFNKSVTNRITRLFAGRAPWFAIVIHTGRKSGKEYRTPLNAFPTKDGFAIALTYGPDTDWVKNVLASGSCSLEYRGHTIPLTSPSLTTVAEIDDTFPRPVRVVLSLINVDQVLLLRRAAAAAQGT
jgi:deazaflavin-dependent oxidoreductase (nitroreductase family)